MHTDAVISADGHYRYRLRRWWTEAPRFVRFIMLNPSIADATTDDPTIRRCVAFAQAWNYGGILVHNLYALRSTDPRVLGRHPDPWGPQNDLHLTGGADPQDAVDLTVCAWGANPMVELRRTTVAATRACEVVDLLRLNGTVPHHIGLTKAGHPRHPLYVRGDTRPAPLEP